MNNPAQFAPGICPSGVPYVALGDVCKISVGGGPPKSSISKEKMGKYKIPVYSNGTRDKGLYGWAEEAEITSPCVTVSARGTIGNAILREEPFAPIVRLICITPSSIIDAGFLKYAVEMIKFHIPCSGVPQLTVPMVSKYKIPCPPLHIQHETAQVLWGMECFIEGLKRELLARKKQYGYYREHMFKFDSGVKYQELGVVCSYVDYRGKSPEKSNAGRFLVTAKNIKEGYIDYGASEKYVSLEDYDNVMKRGRPKLGDVLITTEAPYGHVAQVDREDIALAQRVVKYRGAQNIINNSFLKYFLLTKEFQTKLKQMSTGGT
ncbi:MAG: restriction endonuclease subunit S, partial [Clostridiales bacterium]|nr:restriction endonuclease subunit S [Clostridiales bacterium]